MESLHFVVIIRAVAAGQGQEKPMHTAYCVIDRPKEHFFTVAWLLQFVELASEPATLMFCLKASQQPLFDPSASKILQL